MDTLPPSYVTEIERLDSLQKPTQFELEDSWNEVKKSSRDVPEVPAFELILRKKTTLERSFDRALGQPMPPPLKLQVSRT